MLNSGVLSRNHSLSEKLLFRSQKVRGTALEMTVVVFLLLLLLLFIEGAGAGRAVVFAAAVSWLCCLCDPVCVTLFV